MNAVNNDSIQIATTGLLFRPTECQPPTSHLFTQGNDHEHNRKVAYANSPVVENPEGETRQSAGTRYGAAALSDLRRVSYGGYRRLGQTEDYSGTERV